MAESIADRKISFLDLKMADEPAQSASDHRSALSMSVATRKRTSGRGINLQAIIMQVAAMAVVAALSFGAYFTISHFLIQSVQVVGTSMVPTLQAGGHYILNRLAYRQVAPHRGDIVVINDPGDHGFSVKRVVALEGETIRIAQGKVFINGQPLNEPYLSAKIYTFIYSQPQEETLTCGKGQFFVLGDNRPASIDSRAYGPVTREDILGQIILGK